MPPALLIFIVGPGGPRPLKGYWQTRPRTLFEGLFSSPTTPPNPTPGPGTQRPMDVGEQGERKSPCAQRTHLVPVDPDNNEQGLVS